MPTIFSKLRHLFESRRSREESDDEVDIHIAMLAERFAARRMRHFV